MIDRRPALLIPLFAAVLACSIAFPSARSARAAPVPPFAYTIARARTMAAGRSVTVEGIVTVASGVVDRGFAIQDATGGIYIAGDGALHLAPGERVRVTGTLSSSHGLLTLAQPTVRRIGRGRIPRPRNTRTGAVGEATEGRLVRARGTAADSVRADLPYGYKLWIDDGSGPVQVFIPAGAGAFDTGSIHAETRVTVTGLSGEYDRVYEVIPRSPADLVVSSGPR